MTILDAPLRAVAQDVVGLLGTTITLRHVTVGEYNPEDGGVVGNAATDETVSATIGRYRKSEIGDTIQLNDIPVLIPALNLDSAPSTKDRLVIDSKVYEVVSVESIYSGDQVAAYRVQARI